MLFIPLSLSNQHHWNSVSGVGFSNYILLNPLSQEDNYYWLNKCYSMKNDDGLLRNDVTPHLFAKQNLSRVNGTRSSSFLFTTFRFFFGKATVNLCATKRRMKRNVVAGNASSAYRDKMLCRAWGRGREGKGTLSFPFIHIFKFPHDVPLCVWSYHFLLLYIISVTVLLFRSCNRYCNGVHASIKRQPLSWKAVLAALDAFLLL